MEARETRGRPPLGLVAGNPNFPAAWSETVEKIKLADQLGYDSVWVAETWGYDPVASMAELALVTERIKIGSGILNVFSRTPGTIASTFATLDERSGGRMILGLGSSGANVIEHWHGVPFDRPLRRIREYVEIINLILRHEKLVYQGEIFKLERGFKLQFTPLRDHIPIYIAALTPKSIAQTGAIADGILPTYWPSHEFPTLHRMLDEGAVAAGRPPGGTAIAPYITTAVVPEGDERAREIARMKAREPIAFYVGRMGRFYAEMLARYGYADEVAAIQRGWQEGPKAAVAAVSDKMLDATAIVGTPSEVRAKLREWAALGVDQPLISLPPGSSDAVAPILDALVKD
ncbi:MAG: LLM class flavin-dependent oxidoreductase [Chloroflexota bacterium]|nr:LLM class flavin-dependent oxidoreductase [Chloroflexota bacterium]